MDYLKSRRVRCDREYVETTEEISPGPCARRRVHSSSVGRSELDELAIDARAQDPSIASGSAPGASISGATAPDPGATVPAPAGLCKHTADDLQRVTKLYKDAFTQAHTGYFTISCDI